MREFVDRVWGETEGLGKRKRAERFAEAAETLVSQVLRPGRRPQRRTVEGFLRDGRLESVLTLYTTAIEFDPAEPTYPWNLAATLRRIGFNDLALAFTERAIRVGADVDPEEWSSPGYFFAWADTAIAAGQYDVALVSIANAVRAR